MGTMHAATLSETSIPGRIFAYLSASERIGQWVEAGQLMRATSHSNALSTHVAAVRAQLRRIPEWAGWDIINEQRTERYWDKWTGAMVLGPRQYYRVVTPDHSGAANEKASVDKSGAEV